MPRISLAPDPIVRGAGLPRSKGVPAPSSMISTSKLAVRSLAVDPDGSRLIHWMGMLYRIDQRLTDEQAYGSCLFGRHGSLLAKTTHNLRALGIGERARNRIDDLA